MRLQVYVCLGRLPVALVRRSGPSTQSLSQAMARDDDSRAREDGCRNKRRRQNFATMSGATTRFKKVLARKQMRQRRSAPEMEEALRRQKRVSRETRDWGQAEAHQTWAPRGPLPQPPFSAGCHALSQRQQGWEAGATPR